MNVQSSQDWLRKGGTGFMIGSLIMCLTFVVGIDSHIKKTFADLIGMHYETANLRLGQTESTLAEHTSNIVDIKDDISSIKVGIAEIKGDIKVIATGIQANHAE